jgi:hypothetical protein
MVALVGGCYLEAFMRGIFVEVLVPKQETIQNRLCN